MNEDEVVRWLIILALGLTSMFGVISLFLFIGAAVSTDGVVLASAFCSSVVTALLGFGTWCLTQIDDPKGIGSPTENALLNNKQKRELRRARGGVVLEKALVEVEHERQNITHMQIEASKDPEKPPHKTQWSPEPGAKSLPTGYQHPPHHEHYPYTEEHG